MPKETNWFTAPIKVVYDNDVGSLDEGFWEWWALVDAKGVIIAKCDDENVANKLAELLNENPSHPKTH
jgi:hypothetical protein